MSIREQLVLDASEAFAAAERLERALRDAVTVPPGALGGLEGSLRDAQVSAARTKEEMRGIEQAARDAARSAARLQDETNLIGAGAKLAEADYRGVAAALGISETNARQLTGQVVASQTASVRLDQATRELAQNLGLSERQARDLAVQLGRAASETDGVGDSTTGVATLGAAVGGLTASLGRLAVGAAAAFGVSGAFRGLGSLVSDFAAFDDALNQSLAIVDDVGPGLRDQFAEVARTVGRDMRFSAEQAAEGFFFLASAGLSAEAQLAALPQVAQFAQAGMFDLALATDLLVKSQNALGLASDDAEENLANMQRVADVLVEANNASTASVQEFAEALTNRAAAAARLVGISVEETVGILAAFAQQGLAGAAAGEAFAIVVRDLQRAALENEDAFREFGVSVFDAAGNLLPLADIVASLETALDGMSDAQVRATLTTLGFQDRSVSNLLTLLGTSDAIRDYTRRLEEAGGATERLAERQLTSLAARLEIAKGQIDDAKLSIGEALVPAVEALADAAPKAADAVEDLTPAIAGLAASFSGVVSDPGTDQFLSILASLPVGIGQVVDTLKLVPTFTTGLTSAFGSAFSSAVTGDIDGVASAFDGLGESVSEFRENTATRIISQRLIGDLRAGTDATLALANALAGIKQIPGGVIDPEFVERLTTIAGTDLNQTARALDLVRDEARRLGLSGTELYALDSALRDIGQDARDVRDAAREAGSGAATAGAAFGDAAAPAEELATALTGVAVATDDAEVAFVTMAEALDLASQGVAVAAASVRENLDILSGAVEDSGTTADEALRNLRDQVTAAAEFETNIVFLIAAGFDALATELLDQGPAAAGAAAGFVADMSKAAEAEALLEGQGTEAANRIVAELSAALQSGTVTREAAAAFVGLADQFSSPAVARAFLDAFPVDAAIEGGREAGEAYVAELAERLAGEGVSASIATALATSLGSQAVADAAGVSSVVAGESYVAELAGVLAGEGMSGAAASALAGALAADAVQEAAGAAGERGGSAYVDGLLRRLEEDRESIGSALGGAFGATAAIGSAEDAGARAAQAWIQGARGPKGFKFGSPSKIAVDIGRQLAADLSGAFATNLALNVPAPTVNNNLSFSFASGQDAGRAAAIAGQVTGLLGVVRR